MSSNHSSIFSSTLALLVTIGGCSSSGSNGARLPASTHDNGTDSGLTAKVIDAGPPAPGPSCDGLPATCGSTGDGSCCESPLVPGGKFFRSYDGIVFEDQSYPATVSDFRLDTYEVTVGRFRRFVAAYAQDMVPAGASKNPNDAADTGWDPAWNALLPSDPAALMISLACKPDIETWTDAPGANENRPLNCFTWYEAFAFCIWDGGRLPTEAEWNYAAGGGFSPVNTDGPVMTMPIGGGPIAMLASNQSQPSAIAVGGGNVYWMNTDPITNARTVMKMPVDGGVRDGGGAGGVGGVGGR